MLALGFFGWIIIGGLAGWVASKIKGTSAQQSMVMDVVVGVLGGIIGGWLLSLFNIDVAGHGVFFSFFTCLLGAMILLTILGYVRKK